MKEVKGWVVVSSRNIIVPFRFSTDKKVSIRRAEKKAYRKWDELKNRGYRCIRVTLRTDE